MAPPSCIARLVQGYLAEEGLEQTCRVFEAENQLLNRTRDQQVLFTISLKEVIDDYLQLKEAVNLHDHESEPDPVWAALWRKFDIVVGQLKYASKSKPSCSPSKKVRAEIMRKRKNKISKPENQHYDSEKTKKRTNSQRHTYDPSRESPTLPGIQSDGVPTVWITGQAIYARTATSPMPETVVLETATHSGGDFAERMSHKRRGFANPNFKIPSVGNAAHVEYPPLQVGAESRPVGTVSTSFLQELESTTTSLEHINVGSNISNTEASEMTPMEGSPERLHIKNSAATREVSSPLNSNSIDVQNMDFDHDSSVQVVDEGNVTAVANATELKPDQGGATCQGREGTHPSAIQNAGDLPTSLDHAEMLGKSPKRKGHTPRKRRTHSNSPLKLIHSSQTPPVSNAADSEETIGDDVANVAVPYFLDTFLNTPLLQEKLAANINKVYGSSKSSSDDGSSEPSTATGVGNEDNSSNTDQSTDVRVDDIMSMLESDPAFGDLFAILAADSTTAASPSKQHHQPPEQPLGPELPSVTTETLSMNSTPVTSAEQIGISAARSSTTDTDISAMSEVTESLLLLANSPSRASQPYSRPIHQPVYMPQKPTRLTPLKMTQETPPEVPQWDKDAPQHVRSLDFSKGTARAVQMKKKGRPRRPRGRSTKTPLAQPRKGITCTTTIKPQRVMHGNGDGNQSQSIPKQVIIIDANMARPASSNTVGTVAAHSTLSSVPNVSSTQQLAHSQQPQVLLMQVNNNGRMQHMQNQAIMVGANMVRPALEAPTMSNLVATAAANATLPSANDVPNPVSTPFLQNRVSTSAIRAALKASTKPNEVTNATNSLTLSSVNEAPGAIITVSSAYTLQQNNPRSVSNVVSATSLPQGNELTNAISTQLSDHTVEQGNQRRVSDVLNTTGEHTSATSLLQALASTNLVQQNGKTAHHVVSKEATMLQHLQGAAILQQMRGVTFQQVLPTNGSSVVTTSSMVQGSNTFGGLTHGHGFAPSQPLYTNAQHTVLPTNHASQEAGVPTLPRSDSFVVTTPSVSQGPNIIDGRIYQQQIASSQPLHRNVKETVLMRTDSSVVTTSSSLQGVNTFNGITRGHGIAPLHPNHASQQAGIPFLSSNYSSVVTTTNVVQGVNTFDGITHRNEIAPSQPQHPNVQQTVSPTNHASQQAGIPILPSSDYSVVTTSSVLPGVNTFDGMTNRHGIAPSQPLHRSIQEHVSPTNHASQQPGIPMISNVVQGSNNLDDATAQRQFVSSQAHNLRLIQEKSPLANKRLESLRASNELSPASVISQRAEDCVSGFLSGFEGFMQGHTSVAQSTSNVPTSVNTSYHVAVQQSGSVHCKTDTVRNDTAGINQDHGLHSRADNSGLSVPKQDTVKQCSRRAHSVSKGLNFSEQSSKVESGSEQSSRSSSHDVVSSSRMSEYNAESSSNRVQSGSKGLNHNYQSSRSNDQKSVQNESAIEPSDNSMHPDRERQRDQNTEQFSREEQNTIIENRSNSPAVSSPGSVATSEASTGYTDNSPEGTVPLCPESVGGEYNSQGSTAEICPDSGGGTSTGRREKRSGSPSLEESKSKKAKGTKKSRKSKRKKSDAKLLPVNFDVDKFLSKLHYVEN